MMKIIVDAQLPELLCTILEQIGIPSMHVNNLEHGDETSDVEISHFADSNNLIVMTKDSDFYHSHFINGSPKRL